METKPEVTHTVTQHNDAPDSIELTKNSRDTLGTSRSTGTAQRTRQTW